mgnify:CR=1 FL=1
MTDKLESYRKRTEEEYCRTRKESKRLYDEACRFLPGGDTRTATFFYPYPHFMLRGKGAYMYDADGNKLMDFQNNYTSLIHGHAHGPTVEAIRDQAVKGTAYTAPFENQTKLAELIVSRFPGVDKLRFTNSGTEANMHALRLARAYTGRAKVIKTEGGYHGTTDVFEASVDPNLKIAGSGDDMKTVAENRGVSENALKDVLVVPFNDADRTEKIMKEHRNDTACMIIEPVMASAGQIVPEMGYLRALREMTERYGILLIFDEVVTGRLSTGGAQKYFGITPDITTMGKIIGGGTPVGAFGGRDDIMRYYDPREKKVYHSGTFNGNALTMAAGLAALRDYDENKAAYVNDLGEKFRKGAEKVFEETGIHMIMNGTGSLCNTIFTDSPVKNYRDMAGSHEELNKLLFMTLLLKGVFNAERGMFSMSTAMTMADIETALDRLRESLYEMKEVIVQEAPELIV